MNTIKTRIAICSLLTFISVLVTTPACLGAEKQLDEILSYSEFVEIVKLTVSKVPELKPLWLKSTEIGQEVYLGGGLVRGLLHWLSNELQNKSLNEVRNGTGPRLEELYLQEGTDSDLFVPNEEVAQIIAELPAFSNWDFIDEETFEQAVLQGGPGIDKIRLSPSMIDDPVDGLLHFFSGKLVFHWTDETIYRQLYWVKEMGRSKTTEALRLLRFSHELGLEIDSDSKFLIHQIEKIESDTLPRWNGDPKDSISKALRKYARAIGPDSAKQLRGLIDYNLAPILIRLGYRVPKCYSFGAHLELLFEAGFSMKELKQIEALCSKRFENITLFMDNIVPFVRTADDFLTLASVIVPHPSQEYLDFVSRWTAENIDAFLQLNPTQQERADLARLHPSLTTPLEVADQVSSTTEAGNKLGNRLSGTKTCADSLH